MKENKPTNGWDILNEHMGDIIIAAILIVFLICMTVALS